MGYANHCFIPMHCTMRILSYGFFCWCCPGGSAKVNTMCCHGRFPKMEKTQLSETQLKSKSIICCTLYGKLVVYIQESTRTLNISRFGSLFAPFLQRNRGFYDLKVSVTISSHQEWRSWRSFAWLQPQLRSQGRRRCLPLRSANSKWFARDPRPRNGVGGRTSVAE